MALYRNGTASMDAQGNITGVGTKWKEPLSLIRTGATIVFLTSPIKLAVINTIVSDTSMTAISTDGAAVPNGNYVILLNDSLTVDGMAQDVAETLRYYQSRETVIEDAIEFFEDYDIQQLIDLKNQTLKYRNDAEGFKTSAASSATAATTAKTAAETARTQAQQAQTGAQTARNDAQTAKGQAETARTQAQTYRDQAEQFANSVNADNLAQLDSANTFQQTQTFNKAIRVNSTYADAFLLQGVNPTIKFRETDKPSGAPEYSFVFDGGSFRIQREDSGQYALSYDYSTNTITMPRATFTDKAATRNNLELGLNSSPEFYSVYARGGIEVRTLSDGTEPSASLVARRASASGTTIVSSEMRSNQNGSVEWIKRDAAGSPRSIQITEDNYVRFNSLVPAPQNLEIGLKYGAGAKYIDFHYDGTKGYDYSARIMCDGMNQDQSGGGNLRFNAGFMSFSAPAGLRFDNQTISINDGAGSVCQARTNGQAAYLLFRDGGSNYGYVGFPSAGSKEATLYNYTMNRGIRVGSKFYLVGGDTEVDNLQVNGSSIYVRGGSGTSNTHLWLQNTAGRNRAVVYSSDTQVLQLRSDNASTGASGQALSIYGATGECRATTFTNTSDARAKFWRKKVTGALDKICSLSGETFSMHTTIQDTVRKAGLIAQDVQKVLPEAVTVGFGKTDVIDKECRVVEDPLALDYSALSALYVEAIKELKGEVDALKEEIKKLKGE